MSLLPVMFLYRMHEPIIPRGARQGPSQLKRTCSIFAYEDIKEVHKRRYLLQVTWILYLECFDYGIFLNGNQYITDEYLESEASDCVEIEAFRLGILVGTYPGLVYWVC